MTERPLWHCPKCGARLVTRNLWHSCGRFTLEALFSGSAPGVLAAARKYAALLESLDDVQVLPKTGIVNGIQHQVGREPGGSDQGHPAHVRFTHIYVLRDGRWQLVSSQITPVLTP